MLKLVCRRCSGVLQIATSSTKSNLGILKTRSPHHTNIRSYAASQPTPALAQNLSRKKKRSNKTAANSTQDAPTRPPRKVSNSGMIVTAYCTTQGYDMEKAWQALSERGIQPRNPRGILHPEEPQVIHIDLPVAGTDGELGESLSKKSVPMGDAFVFATGVIVSWGVDKANISQLMNNVLQTASQKPLGDNAEDETLEYLENTQGDRSILKGETIILGTQGKEDTWPPAESESLSTRLQPEKVAFSAGLARAVRLGVVENLVDEFSQESPQILALLDAGPFARMKSRRWIYRKLAHLLELRAQAYLYTEIADDLPDLLWDTKQELGLEALYNQTGVILGVSSRFRTLNSRLDQLENLLQVLRDMRSEIHSSRLEWIIIWLILIEVLHIAWIELYRKPQEGDKPTAH